MSLGPDWKRVTKPDVPPYHVFTKPIERSQQDDREYRIIKLDNGLEATLVHYAKADKAAASLDVAVGHLSDPDDIPGLAHFCEHLLFMGTEQYPRENEYSEFLAKNNGASNAYTSVSNTNYYFSVATTALPGALSRFAAFFHCPLFAPSCTTRELNAVDSENQKNLQNDVWRIYQVNKHLSKPGHVWRKFATGNKQSISQAARDLKETGKIGGSESSATSVSSDGLLTPSPASTRSVSPSSVVSTNSEAEADGGVIGRETRRRLVEWWTKEYCASRMNLCVVGKESLDELSDLAAKLFSPVANRGYDKLPMFTDHPYGPGEKGTLVAIQTIMSFYALEMTFPLEWQNPLWKTKPAYFIGHLVGHEGPGSLHSYLKNKGWITALSSGPHPLARGFDMFKVTAYLTEDGFKNYKNIIIAIARYLSLLRESKFESYLQGEQAILHDISFRFLEKGRPDDYASGLAARMPNPYPRELLLAAPHLIYPWNDNADPGEGEHKVKEYLNSFQLENGRVVLMARPDMYSFIESKAEWETEPWYGTKYRIERFDEDFLTQLHELNNIPELFLPKPNEFIPTSFDVEKKENFEPIKRPHLIHRTPSSSLWHKKDDRFWVPKAIVAMDFRNPLANETPRFSVLNKLFAELVTDSLTEYSYNAQLAGLNYRLNPSVHGLFMTLAGYNDKLGVLVHHVLDKSKNLVVDPERLAVVKDEVKRSFENFFLTESYKLSEFYIKHLMVDKSWTVEEKMSELESITVEDVQDYINKFFSQAHLRTLITGNIDKHEAIKMAEVAEVGLGDESLVERNVHDLIIPEGCNLTWTSKVINPAEPNNSMTYYVRYGSAVDQQLRIVAALLSEILKEPSFNVLRTQEQLGYIVSCVIMPLGGFSEVGLRVLVQSEKTAGYCEDRVEAFFDSIKTQIEEMTPEVFEEQKEGLIKKWTEKPKNLAEEADKFLAQIGSGQLDFLRYANDAELLKNVTKNDVYDLFMSKVHSSSKTRSKLSVHMLSQKPRVPVVSPVATRSFEALVREKVTGLDEQVFKDAPSGDNIALTAFGQYWMKVLETRPGGVDVLKAIPAIVEQNPAPGHGPNVPRAGVQYIDDPKVFRAGLPVGPDPLPLVQWNDLPTANL